MPHGGYRCRDGEADLNQNVFYPARAQPAPHQRRRIKTSVVLVACPFARASASAKMKGSHALSGPATCCLRALAFAAISMGYEDPLKHRYTSTSKSAFEVRPFEIIARPAPL